MNRVDNMYGSRIAQELEESIQVKHRTIEGQMTTLDQILQALLKALRGGNKVILFGNGGSAADSQHIAAEFVNRFRRERRAMPAVALTTDTSVLTSIANDYSYENIFARQIEAFGDAGDVAWGISTSGNSPNVIKAVGTARRMGITTIGFTGDDGGQLKEQVDICFCVPSHSTPRIQEVHITAAHALCELIEEELTGSNE